MGDYCTPRRGVTEIIPLEGPIMPPDQVALGHQRAAVDINSPE